MNPKAISSRKPPRPEIWSSPPPGPAKYAPFAAIVSGYRCLLAYPVFFTGDGARRDETVITGSGRVDDVMNVSGHRVAADEAL